MTQARSQLAAGVYRLCGDPADAPLQDGGLPMQTVFDLLTEVEDSMLRDIGLSEQSRRVDKVELSLRSSTFTIPRSDFSGAAHVYLRTDATSDFWYPVEIVSHGSLNRAGWDSKLAVAFYGSPLKGEVSWVPEAGQTLQIWYDRSGEESPLMAGQTDISSLYDSHLKLQAAAQARELMGLPVGDVLKTRLVKGEGQWAREVARSRQQGSAEKPMAFPLIGRRVNTAGNFRSPR